MPLGLMPGMQYKEQSATLQSGEHVLFYSDGLVEAHNAQRDMFSYLRLRTLVAEHPAGDGAALIRFLLAELQRFTGTAWEQEDDITLVTLRRCAAA
jgi:sigma-B regulation protein RsbU (phosphoserine phosphatase)